MRLPALSPARSTGARAVGLIATLGSAAALAALGAAASPAAGAAAAPARPACQTGGLVAWINNENGTAGSIFYTLNFTNQSGHTCTLRGYPGVSAVNLRNGRIGNPASRAGGTKVKTVTLTNNATATATLRIEDAGIVSPSACREKTAAGLRVFPPNQTASKVVPLPFAACSHGGSNLSIQAVRAER